MPPIHHGTGPADLHGSGHRCGRAGGDFIAAAAAVPLRDVPQHGSTMAWWCCFIIWKFTDPPDKIMTCIPGICSDIKKSDIHSDIFSDTHSSSFSFLHIFWHAGIDSATCSGQIHDIYSDVLPEHTDNIYGFPHLTGEKTPQTVSAFAKLC